MAVYANYGGILPEYQSVGLSQRLLTEANKEHMRRGYQIVYFTSTTSRILAFCLRMGATIVKECKCDDPEFKGETYALVKGVYAHYKSPEVKKKEIKPKI